MIKKWLRSFLPNPFDRMLKKQPKRILLAWNRGLGDIALGLYAMVERIREITTGSEITFIIRENLWDGFSLLSGVNVIVAPSWKRGESYDVRKTLLELGIDPKQFDLIVEKPNPTEWVRWQLGKVVPKLQWKKEHDALAETFQLPKEFIYIGVQASAETAYGQWRNWPLQRWKELVALLEPNVKIILFGFGKEVVLEGEQVIDLRGETTLFEMMSLIKNKCSYLIVPDSGVLSMIYYLDEIFPIHVVSLWAEGGHGILKQNVKSPNPLLVHSQMMAKERDLSTVSAKTVYEKMFPSKRAFKPLERVTFSQEIGEEKETQGIGCVILAGGQGTRLGIASPKGMFSVGGKTLFQRIVDKIPEGVPIAIMTSSANHEETIRFFEKNHHFGKKVFFFCQGKLPLLDENRRPFGLDAADGNGSFYHHFETSKVADAFSELGVETITITPVDNALAHPLDPKWLSFHKKNSLEVSIRCIERTSAEESMGVLAQGENGLEVLEYSEIDPNEMGRIREDGKPLYLYAYTALVAMSLPFIRKAASLDLPIHWVQKNIVHEGKSLPVWKGEKFLFDAFGETKLIGVLCSPREECYAPLKRKDGPNGIEAVEKALCQ